MKLVSYYRYLSFFVGHYSKQNLGFFVKLIDIIYTKKEVSLKLLFCTIILALSGCSSLIKEENLKLKLRILHTNDHHGHYLQDRNGQAGMAARKTLINQLRSNILSEGGKALLLSGGDINTGTMESDMFDAEPDFLGMKYIGYDAMALGNHEFDNAYKVLQKQKKLAGFPFLSANIFWKNTNKRVFEPSYIIKNLNGVKVGIFGLTTADTPFKASHPDAKNKFEFRSIIDSAKEVVAQLRNQEKVDLIIAVTHVGHRGSNTSNGDIDLAKAVNGIDVIVGGHSQEIINAEEHNGTVIVQAEDWGKYVGVLDLYIDINNKRLKFEYKLRPVNLKRKSAGVLKFVEKEIKQDLVLQNFFATYKIKADALGDKVVGTLANTLDGSRQKVRSRQMPIGQFMGDSLMFQVKGVDIVALNGGSIRATLNEGKVSRKDIHNVHPYGNTISTVELSAEELFRYMKTVLSFAIVDSKNLIGGYPHIINAKIRMKNNKLESIAARNNSWFIKIKNGKIHSNKKKFTLGTMNFLARGGDNYPKITDNKTYNDTGFMINAAMMNYIENQKELKTKKYHSWAKNNIIFN